VTVTMAMTVDCGLWAVGCSYDCEGERWYSEVDTGRCVRKVDN